MAGPTLFPRIGGQSSRKCFTTTSSRMPSRKLNNFALHSTDSKLPTKLRSSQFRSSPSVAPAKKSEPAKGKVHEQSLLNELIEAVSAQKSAILLWRGDVNGKFISDPIVLRWDSPSEGVTRKLTFPLSEVDDGVTAIEGLLRDCAPTTFGTEGELVLDECYLEATKLDTHQFSTNFNPYDVGIVDAVGQILLASMAEGWAGVKTTFADNVDVAAELYTLNIYSGPSGKFEPHLDIARGYGHFGFLVISLPYPHVGGQLRVAYEGQEVTCDWSQKEADKIQWAAFYCGCENEVLEVKSGHRITLTYNLYLRQRLGGIMRQKHPVSSYFCGLSDKIKKLWRDPNFMTKGGTLGFYCQHAYAHTNSQFRNRQPYDLVGLDPYALKGVDAVFYSIFHYMGLEVKLLPVMSSLPKGDLPDEGYEKYISEEPEAQDNKLDESLQGQQETKDLLNEGGKGGRLIGSDLHEITMATDGIDFSDQPQPKYMSSGWQWGGDNRIVWFNEPRPSEAAVVLPPYDHQPSLNWHDAEAVILIEVPAFGSELREKAFEGQERKG